MSKKDRFCIDCGEPCWGRRCKDCFKKGKYRSVGRLDSRKKHYEKRTQKVMTLD